MAEKGKWLFDKPQGPSIRNYSSQGTISQIQCEGCGTIHEELGQGDSSRRFIVFNGYEIVEECCGAYIDEFYDLYGEMFFRVWCNEFEQDSLAQKHLITRICIESMVKAWDKEAKRASEESDKILAQLPLE